MWTDWNDYDSSTAGSNEFCRRKYRNGQRLKKNKQRPIPFYVKVIDFHILPCYNRMIQKQICRRLIRGAYSRKYDRVRKKRKRRIF